MTIARIAKLNGLRRIDVVDVALSEPQHGQVLIRMTEAAVRGAEGARWADEYFWRKGNRGPATVPPIGREGAGIIEAVGPGVIHLAVGDRVVPWFASSHARPQPNALATHTILEARNCARVAADNRFAVLGEVIGGALNAVEITGPRPGQNVLIVGTGAVAQAISLLCWSRGVEAVAVVGRRDEALTQIGSLHPGTRVVNGAIDPAKDAVRDVFGAAGADIVYEATGGEQQRLASSLVRLGGADGRPTSRLAFVGRYTSRVHVSDGRRPREIVNTANCHFGRLSLAVPRIAAGMRLVESSALDLSGLRLAEFPLDRIDEAFAAADARPAGLARSVVTFI